ncbi:MAG: glycosyltransferase family 2 protein, partial [Promethearchaeia archaeon]
MFKHKKVIVIIPAYNTEKEIYHVFKNLKQVSRYFSEIIVLDDNSSDNTLKSLRDIRKKWKNEKKIFILKHKKNLGYGATQKHLFEVFLRRKGDIAVLIHADNQYPPNNIKNLVKPILNGKADIVVASRFYGNMRYYSEMPVYKILGNKVLTLIENIAINTHLSEFHTGLRSYSKKAIEKLNFEQFSN